MRPLRIALNGLFLQWPATGTGQYLRALVRTMAALEPEVELVLIAPRADPTVPVPLQIRPTWARQADLAKVEFEHITFPRAATRGGFTLAHIPHFGPPLLAALPTVVTIHDLIPLALPAYRGSPLVRLYTWLAARGARRATRIIADSNASARDVEHYLGISSERMRVVPLAAAARYRPIVERAELARVRATYNLPERFILYLGGFDVRKNVWRLMEIFAALEEERRGGWKLVLAGKLPERDSAFFPDPRRLAAEKGVLGEVHFTGFVNEEDKPALYTLARAFLFPSEYEGFGLPPLEAMACGTPVVASNRSALPEVVGAGGLLIAPDDVGGWCAALRALLNDEAIYAAWRARGMEQARRFTWERTARATLAVYAECA